MRIRIGASARREAHEAVVWYREQTQSDAPDRFWAEFLRLQQLIADAPESWPQIEPGIHRVLFRGFPFSVLYKIEENCVMIIAVAHQRRRPGYWRNR